MRKKVSSAKKRAAGRNREEALLLEMHDLKKKLAAKEKYAAALEKRINGFIDVILSFSKLDLSVKAQLSERGDHLDALATGINMLGEELRSSMISLHEKEVLLREIHHRVKNNLQIVSSLLNLQSTRISDPHIQRFFEESRGRIKSMALVHEKLYKSRDISNINFGSYLQTLCEGIRDFFGPEKTAGIRMELDAEAHFLKVDTAIPCGLIVNELLMNCYKYAFAGKKKGSITLRFRKEKNGRKELFMLEVCDNGKGLPSSFNIDTAESLGLQLVQMLSGQLGGTLKYANANGAAFCVQWPAE